MSLQKEKAEILHAIISLGKARDALGIIDLCPIKLCSHCLEKIAKEKAKLKYLPEKAGEIFVKMNIKEKI